MILQTDGAMVDGLSPRVRGNLAHENEVEGLHGSIPARAGEPVTVGYIVYSREVYPRACGGTITVEYWTNG